MRNIINIKHLSYYLIIIITSISFFLRIYNLNFQSLWLDELYTINFSSSNNSLNDVFNYLKNDGAHPSLYYLIVHYIFNFTGDSGFILRIISCLLGTLMIPLGFYLGKIFLDKKLGLIISILFCFNPYLIKYSQEGRMYIMFALLCLLIIIYFYKYLKYNNTRDLYFFTLSLILICNTHFYGYFISAALGIIILIEKFNIIRLKDIIINIFLIVISSIPNYLIITNSIKKTSFWIKKPNTNFLMEYLNEFNNYNEFITFFMLLLVYHGVTKSYKLQLNKISYYLFIVLFTYISLPLLISYLKLPMIVSRHFIGFYVIFLILVSISIRTLKINIQCLILISIVFISFFPFFYLNKYYGTLLKEDFRGVSEYIAENPDKKFFFMKKEMFNYYLNDNKLIEDSINGVNSKLYNEIFFIERDGISTFNQDQLINNELSIVDTIDYNNLKIIHLKKL